MYGYITIQGQENIKKALLGYNAEQYWKNDKIFWDIHSIPSSDLMKISVLPSLIMASKRYPETSIIPIISLHVTTQKSYNIKYNYSIISMKFIHV